jgi:predicted N-formylglutamate amidohydrolase
MTFPDNEGLLCHDSPWPVNLINAAGPSPFLLLGDHGGNEIPSSLGDLGLSEADRQRHIAWDIGVRGLGELLADRLDAAFVHQACSRLVIDCNRDPQSPELIPAVSDGTPIPGNQALSDAARRQRIDGIHRPYHDSIGRLLDERQAAGRETILVALHSFTPSLGGNDRPWQVGILHWQGDTRFAMRLLDVLHGAGDLVVGDNEPYQMDGTDFTIPLHAFARGLPYAEIEVRQDLIAGEDGQLHWADRLSDALAAARSSPGGRAGEREREA